MYYETSIMKSKLTCDTEVSSQTISSQFNITPFLSSPSVWSLSDSNSSQGSLCDSELDCLEDSSQVLLLYPEI